jgi:hypothetical protein
MSEKTILRYCPFKRDNFKYLVANAQSNELI